MASDPYSTDYVFSSDVYDAFLHTLIPVRGPNGDVKLCAIKNCRTESVQQIYPNWPDKRPETVAVPVTVTRSGEVSEFHAANPLNNCSFDVNFDNDELIDNAIISSHQAVNVNSNLYNNVSDNNIAHPSTSSNTVNNAVKNASINAVNNVVENTCNTVNNVDIREFPDLPNASEVNFQSVNHRRNSKRQGVSSPDLNPANKIAKTILSSSIKCVNRFSALENESGSNNDNILIENENEISVNNNSAPSTSKNLKDNSKLLKQNKSIRNTKTRFITVKPRNDSEIMVLLKQLDDKLPGSFEATPAGEFVKIHPKSPENYKLIADTLAEINAEFYTIPEKSSLPLKVVIRGLDKRIPCEDISEALQQINFTPLKVVQLKKFNKEKTPMPLFQIQLPATPENNKIFELNRLLYYAVKIEEYRRPSRTIMCYNCQFYHHTSSQCKMKPRCNKCAGDHHYKDCPKQYNEPVTCCNCGENHVANYRGCKKFPENRKQIPRLANPNISYASHFKNNPPQNQSQASNPPLNSGFIPTVMRPTPHHSESTKSPPNFSKLTNILDAIAKEFSADSFDNLINKFSDILARIQKCDDESEKLNILYRALKSVPTPAHGK